LQVILSFSGKEKLERNIETDRKFLEHDRTPIATESGSGLRREVLPSPPNSRPRLRICAHHPALQEPARVWSMLEHAGVMQRFRVNSPPQNHLPHRAFSTQLRKRKKKNTLFRLHDYGIPFIIFVFIYIIIYIYIYIFFFYKERNE
jgi:hypothetical protein